MTKIVGVYAIRNAVNEKVYVGQATNVHGRWRQHRHLLNKGEHLNRHLQAAWREYGASAFTFDLLLECPPSDLGRWEIEALALVPEHLRYNIGPAGDNPTRGLKKRHASKLKQSRSKGGRPFFAKNLGTGVETRFEYLGDFSSDRMVQSEVNRFLHERRKMPVNGHTFRYDLTFTPVPFVKKAKRGEKRNREVVGTCLTTGLEVHFPFVAAVEPSFQRTGVIKCLSGEMHKHRGYTWRYVDGAPHQTMTQAQRSNLRVGPRKRGGSRAVVAKHVSTGEVSRFTYVAEAARAVGLHPSAIHNALSGRIARAGNYTWTFAP